MGRLVPMVSRSFTVMRWYFFWIVGLYIYGCWPARHTVHITSASFIQAHKTSREEQVKYGSVCHPESSELTQIGLLTCMLVYSSWHIRRLADELRRNLSRAKATHRSICCGFPSKSLIWLNYSVRLTEEFRIRALNLIALSKIIFLENSVWGSQFVPAIEWTTEHRWIKEWWAEQRGEIYQTRNGENGIARRLPLNAPKTRGEKWFYNCPWIKSADNHSPTMASKLQSAQRWVFFGWWRRAPAYRLYSTGKRS